MQSTQNKTDPNDTSQSLNSHSLIWIFRQCALISTCLVGAFAAIETVGWTLGIDRIKHPIPHAPSIPSGSAILFLATSIALLLMSVGRHQFIRTRIGQLLAIVIAIAGGSTFIEHTFNLDWALAFPLYQTKDSMPLTFPGPMLPDMSFYFVIVGISRLFSFFSQSDWIQAGALSIPD